MLNFIRYDPATGVVTSKGYMNPDVINQLIVEGNPIIKYESDVDIDIERMRINIETGAIEFVEPPPPPPPLHENTISFVGLLDLFTGPEKVAIVSSPDPQVKLFTLMAAGSTVVSLNAESFVNGLDYLISMGILEAPRKQQILDRTPPAS